MIESNKINKNNFKNLKNLKLSTRINSSFIFIIIIIIINNSWIFHELNGIRTIHNEFNNGPHKVIYQSMGIKVDIESIGRSVNNSFYASDKETPRTEILKKFEEINEKINTIENLLPEGDREGLNGLKSSISNFKNEYEKIYSLTKQKDFDIYKTKIDFSSYDQALNKSLLEIDSTNNICNEMGANLSNQIDENFKLAILLSGLILLISMIICILLARSFKKSINEPINEIKNAATKMANGDFDFDIDVKSKDELGDLSNSMIEMSNKIKIIIDDTVEVLDEVSNGDFTTKPKVEYVGVFENIKNSITKLTTDLSETINQINLASEEVDSASRQVSQGAQMLAQGATEQASAIEELSSIIMDVSDKINDSTENAKKANVLSLSTGEEVKAGNNKMKEMIKAMGEISSSSNEIEKIMKTIDDIAFQTNILALNAAVEAARAGEAGKGFAVVADEVRNLASKSADAAKQTASLIENSIVSVENGIYIVDETASSLQKIIDKTNETISLVDQIAKASEEQSLAMNQVTLGVEQISQVVQTNSATSEESAATSEELSAQVTSLKSLIDHFKTDSNYINKEELTFNIFD